MKEKKTRSGFSLSSLKCCPTVLDTIDGERHIRLGGHNFWIQMVSQDITKLDDDTSIEVKLTGSCDLPQRISRIEQLSHYINQKAARLRLLSGLLTEINYSKACWLGMFMMESPAKKGR